MLKKDGRALVVAAGSAQRAADYILDRQPAGAADRAAGREREREQEADAQREDDGRVATADLEPWVLAGAGRGPEESR